MSLLQALQRRKVLRKSGFLNYISIPNDQSKAYHQATKINLSSGKTFQQAINDGDFACYVEQGRSCGSCGGRIKCDGTCSVSTPNNYGRSCGGNSCTNSGSIRCSGSCGGTSYKPSGTSCGTNKECDGSGSCVSVSAPPPPPTPTCDKSQGSTTRCDGSYKVTDYTDSDCSDERTYCTHGCSGGSCLAEQARVDGICNNNVVNGCISGSYGPGLGNRAPGPGQVYHYWFCYGSGGGSHDFSCDKPKSGVCGSSVDTCNIGTPGTLISDSSTHDRWSCDGTNPGSGIYCSKAKPPECASSWPSLCSRGSSQNFAGTSLPFLGTNTWQCKNSAGCVSCSNHVCGWGGCLSGSNNNYEGSC